MIDRSSRAMMFALAMAAWTCASAALEAQTPRTTLRLAQRIDVVDTLAREPMIVQHPNGTLFAAGYGGPVGDGGAAMQGERPNWLTRLWKSTDRGATWTRVDVQGDRSVVGNSDVDLAIAPDGTVYFASMLYDATKYEGKRIAIGASPDAGGTWRWSVVSTNRFDDRPWVKVAPDGTAHAIWNDGSGVLHTMSRDRGVTWSTPVRIHDSGGSSHLTIGPKGELAVRIVPLSASGNKFDAGVDVVAVSGDGGATWRKHAPPTQEVWKAFGDTTVVFRWVEPMAWDAQGRLYSLWTDTAGVMLARSTDRGASWQKWRIAESRAWCYFPYLVARGDGELAATWLCGKDDAMRATAATITLRGGATTPRVAASQPFAFDSWFPVKGQWVRNAAGEYLGVTFLQRGGIGVVAPIQSETRNGFSFFRFAP